MIHPICITILYHNLLLFIDIFHIMDMILMLFPLFCMYDDYEGNDCRSQNLMEKATPRHHIYEDQKLREKLYYGVLHQKTEIAKRRGSGGPQGAHTCSSRAWAGCGHPGPPLAEPLRVLHPLGVKTLKISSQNSSAAAAGRETQREENSPAGRNLPGKFLEERGKSSPSSPPSSWTSSGSSSPSPSSSAPSSSSSPPRSAVTSWVGSCVVHRGNFPGIHYSL